MILKVQILDLSFGFKCPQESQTHLHFEICQFRQYTIGEGLVRNLKLFVHFRKNGHFNFKNCKNNNAELKF